MNKPYILGKAYFNESYATTGFGHDGMSCNLICVPFRFSKYSMRKYPSGDLMNQIQKIFEKCMKNKSNYKFFYEHKNNKDKIDVAINELRNGHKFIQGDDWNTLSSKVTIYFEAKI